MFRGAFGLRDFAFAAGPSRVPEKLLIPPPVPHPAHISVIIHNRDATEQIPLEETLTRQVSALQWHGEDLFFL